MEKDKESLALLENKRHEFRCNQVVKAMNKEKDLRERELLHERNQIRARLQKLIEKRKELNLDPTKTRELQMYLSAGIRAKNRGKSPQKKGSTGKIPQIIETDENGNDVFITNFGRSDKNDPNFLMVAQT